MPLENDFIPKLSPIYGIPMNWCLRDLDCPGSASTEVVAQTSTPADSASLSMGRSIRILPIFENGDVVCTLTVNQNSAVVYTFANVTPLNCASLFVGNREFVDLQGEPFTISVTAVTGGWVKINAHTTG